MYDLYSMYITSINMSETYMDIYNVCSLYILSFIKFTFVIVHYEEIIFLALIEYQYLHFTYVNPLSVGTHEMDF